MQIKHFKCTTQTDSDECQRKGGTQRVGAERSEWDRDRESGKERERGREQWADGGIMGPVLTHLGQLPID